MKKIKSKIFKILLVTTFVLPTIFTQNACSKKKDVEKYENEINKLKEEIKILEKFKSDLSHEFEPFKNLMHKYGVNNYNDLMKELTCLNDPNLQEQVLSLADCLLKTKTITFLKLQEKINDEQWWNENVEILKALVIPFNLKSINDLKGHFTINKEIITFAEKISKATDSDFIKHLEHEIDKLKIDIEHNNQELIPFYLEHLGDDNYTNWEGFIKQFDDLEWKEKNKAIIEKLASALNCSFDEVNKEKIEQLDKDIKNNAKELLVKKKEKWDEWKNKLEQFEQDRKELIPFYLSQLWDESYIGWENFIKQFDDLEWKEKNKTIIERLAEVLGCNFDEVTKEKISQLEGEVRDVLEVIKNQGQLIDKLKELEKCKKGAILFYFDQLWDESYTDWNNFIKQFDNLEWKEKNKAIIENLAFALDCSFDEINQQKIEQLDKDIKDKAQELLNKRKEAWDNWKDKLNEKETKFEQAKKQAIPFYLSQLWDESYTNWDSFITQFDNVEWKEKNKAIIENLALALGCSFNEVTKEKISQLKNEVKDISELIKNQEQLIGKLKELEKCKKELIPSYFDQLWDESYTDWNNFIKQFDNLEWKEKNKAIIENLALALGCSFNEINQQKIEQLDKDIKDKAQELLNKRKEAWDNWKSKLKERSLKWHEIKQYKDGPIAICLGQLGGKNYTGWDNFITQFDDLKWKEKNKEIIDILSDLLDCPNELIDSKRINSLDQKVKIMAQEILIKKCEVAKEQIEQKEKRFISCKNNLIGFCFEQLWDENYTSWENFITQFDDLEWKEKNKAIIEKLTKILGCDYSAINHQKIAGLDQIIVDMVKKLFDEKRANKLKKKWEKNEKQFEQSKKELIAIYLVQLCDENYFVWSAFITKFDDQEWKGKNELVITKLANVLNCSNEEINSKKIDDLLNDKIIMNKLKELVGEKEKVWKEWKEKKENEFALKEKQLEQYKKEIISFYIAKLWWSIYASWFEVGASEVVGAWDVGALVVINHDNWMEFIIKFDDSEWKEKNRTIIEKLAFVLDCSFDEVSKGKIEKLGDEIKNNVKKILDEMEEIEFKFDNKNKLISFYLSQLWDKNYTDWDSFIAQFDNLEWKEKNKAIIENLASALDCSFDGINKQKIKQLDKKIKDKSEELLNKRIVMENENEFALKEKQLEQNKKEIISLYIAMLWEDIYNIHYYPYYYDDYYLYHDDYYLYHRNDWLEFVTQFDNVEWKEKNKAIIENLAFVLNCSFDEINKQKIGQLDKDIKDKAQELLNKRKEAWDNWKDKLNEKETKFEQAKKQAIPFYLSQLWDENYTDWDSFITQFDNVEWKEKNKAIIENLALTLGCSFNEVTKEKISQLKNEVKDISELIKNQEQLIGKLKELEKCKKELIPSCFDQLWDESYTDWNNFITQFDNVEWKEKNKAIIENLAFALNCSFDEINKQKIGQLDEDIKDKAQELLNKRKEAWDNLKDKLEQNKNELIPFYLNQLGDENYTNWDEFIKQFDDLEWKEKNKLSIEKLAFALNCSFDEINKQKIGQLDKDTTDKAQKLLDEKKKMWDVWKKNKEFEHNKKNSIPHYIAYLADENYTNWGEFIKQFDDLEWKEKNKPSIEKLAFALNCSFDEVNKQKIEQLDKDTTDKAQKLLDEKKKIFDVWKDKLEQLEQNKNELIPFYLNQLADENYTNGDGFIKQFDDLKWKEKNKAIIENLAFVLNCSFDEINKQKIGQLDEDIKDKAQELLNKRKEAWDNWREQTLGLKEEQFENDKKELTIFCLDQLGAENYTSWDNFIEQFDDSKWKEENKTIIKELAWIWGYDFYEITKQVINQIDQNMKNETRKILDNKKNMWEELLKQKARQFEQSKEELIVFYLNQLSSENYACWYDFINQFDDQEWKGKNELIITKLANVLNCSNEEINSKKIDGLNKKIKNRAKILLNEKYEILNKFEEELNKIVEEKNLIKQFEYDRDQLIVICFKQLRRKNQIKWNDFLKQFDDSNWKEKNKAIIENLAFALDCSFDEINQQKIDNLIKMHKSLNLDKLSLDNNEKILSEGEEEKFEQSKKELIAIYLVQLWDENYSLWSTFITKFDDQEWKGKNELIITKLANVLNCSNEEINSKKIDDLDEEIKNEFESLIKTNDLNNLLRMNSIKNENLKQNFDKMNNLLKRINVMYKLCYISLGIYTSLADEKIEQKTTITEILEKFNKLHETNKTKVDQTLIKQEKMMRLLYNLMQKLNTQNVGTLIEKINNWLELLKFIIYDKESKKFDKLINIFEDYEKS